MFQRLLVTCATLVLLSSAANADRDLADAVERTDWSSAESLLNKHSASASQADGMTALHWATAHSNQDWIEKLLALGADVNATTKYKVTPLSIACRNGDVASATILLQADANPNQKLAGGMSCLMLAARTGNGELLRKLLEHGADVDAVERKKQSALMFAAAEGHVDAINILLDAGADLHRKLDSGFNPLLFAAREGHIEAVNCLIDRGADVGYQMAPKKTSGRNPRKGMTALMLAVESAHFELAMHLIERGADPNDEASQFAPLHAISWVRRAQLGDNPAGDPEPRGSGSLTSLEFVRALVEAGADVNLALRRGKGGPAKLNTRGATPFLLASQTLDLPLMKLLLELGADPHLANHDGTTPLLAAAGIGVTNPTDGHPGTPEEVEAALRMLLDRGADINLVDKSGETAMHGAAYRCFPDSVRLVATLGADPEIWDQKNRHGWSPLLIAKGYRPGSFKPDPPTIEAITEVMGDRANRPAEEGKSLKAWDDKNEEKATDQPKTTKQPKTSNAS